MFQYKCGGHNLPLLDETGFTDLPLHPGTPGDDRLDCFWGASLIVPKYLLQSLLWIWSTKIKWVACKSMSSDLSTEFDTAIFAIWIWPFSTSKLNSHGSDADVVSFLTWAGMTSKMNATRNYLSILNLWSGNQILSRISNSKFTNLCSQFWEIID